MTSATWWGTPWPRRTRASSPAGWRWTRRYPASGTGISSSAIPRPGTSTSTGRTRSAWGRGRERVYLDRFYNELSADPKGIDEPTRQHYAHLYARPHAIHDAFEQFVAFPQDGVDNRAFLAKGKLTMPVLAIGGEKSYGESLAEELRFVATDVTPLVVPGAGHWLMEEQPAKTVAAITAFLKG